MFYILVSRIPFIYNINEKKDKLFKTFLIGSICYIILHGFLHSRKFSDNNLIENLFSFYNLKPSSDKYGIKNEYFIK